MTAGRLIGVGLGPGDPELVTRKAARIIAAAPVVAYPAPLGGASFARAIAADLISDQAEEIRIEIPMDVARFPAQAVYDRAATTLADRLDGGVDVVVLCEGDPLFYGSFMYLMSRLDGPYEVEVVPGVTSITACAAACRWPLSARNEALDVVPATLSHGALADRIAGADNLAILKAGRHLPKVRQALASADLVGRSVYVSHATLPDRHVCALADAPETGPYFSMVLVRKGGDPWLS